ncbi:MAG: hypothetical protein AAGF12_06835 [Myxococcota bacterium]
MRGWLVAGVLGLVSGCFESHERGVTDAAVDGSVDAEAPDAAPAPECANPSIWSATPPALEPLVLLAGRPCEPPQYPVSPAILAFLGLSNPLEIGELRSCWRVVEADPRSGWSVGDTVSSPGPQASVPVRGFEWPVVFEGRLFRRDGTLTYAVPNAEAALEPPRIVEPAAEDVVAIVEEEVWVTRTAIRIAEEEVSVPGAIIDASGSGLGFSVLERRGDVLVLSLFSRARGQEAEFELGPATAPVLARTGPLVALDDRVMYATRMLGGGWELGEFPFAGPVDSLAMSGDLAFLMVGEELTVQRFDEAPASAQPVGPGQVLPSLLGGLPVFFDGTSYIPFAFAGPGAPPVIDQGAAFRLRPEDEARLGAPIALGGANSSGIATGIIGTLGFALPVDRPRTDLGPRAVSLDELLGDGTVTHLGSDGVTYRVLRSDGSASLYLAPSILFCEF